jgi:uncharacterized protein (TIGR02569 family)
MDFAGEIPPPPSVVKAFGGAGRPERLAGGQGTSWRAGDVVLKPVDTSVEDLEWHADVLGLMVADGVRIARPVRAVTGGVVVDGWCATEWVEGRHERRRWLDVIGAGERLHAALAGVPAPEFIGRRDDPWAIGDRVAWGEQDPAPYLGAPLVAELLSDLRPVAAKSQVIHGDLTGNVLFSEHRAPAIIDFAPYWRPVALGAAIVVGDALIWEGADGSLVRAVRHIPEIDHLLRRALIYRIVTDAEFRRRDPRKPRQDPRFARAVALARSHAG